MKKLALVVLMCCVSSPVLGQGRIPKTDHPLISAYEGSKMTHKSIQEYDQYNAFMGMDESGKEPTGLSLAGKITKMRYKKPIERSIFEIYQNYQNALERAGAEILYMCDQEKKECAKRYAGVHLQKFSDMHSVSNLKGRYLLARMNAAEQTAYVAVGVGVAAYTIHVIEVKDMETDKVALDVAALGKGIDMRGYVVVEGIYFDTDKATLKPASEPALLEIAKLMNARPDLNVYLVGHTDSQGSLTHNQALSQNRANAVMRELAAQHGIDAARMEAHGVGPLSPQAKNTNENGRSKNRRVVLVERVN
ncbi:MAG: OmpA family protein [Bacteroidota bacterium]